MNLVDKILSENNTVKSKNFLPGITIIFLFCFSIFLYCPVLSNDFVNFDDDIYIYKNRTVLNGLTKEGILWALVFQKEKHNFYWQPLTWISLMLDTELFGISPASYHFTNSIIHGGNTVLIFLLLLILKQSFGVSLLTALLFSVHPLAVESVAWAVERKQVLAVFFGLSAFIFHLWSVQEGKKLILWRSMASLFLVLSLMSKPLMVIFPFLLLVIDGCILNSLQVRKRSISRLIVEKIPYFIICGLSLLMTHASLSMQGNEVVKPYSLLLRLQVIPLSYLEYLKKLLLPVNLAVFYPYPGEVSILWVSFGIIFLFGLTFLFFHLIHDKIYLAGWLWFIGTMVPTSGILQAGLWPFVADRFTYFPSIGIFLIIASFAVSVFRRKGPLPFLWGGLLLSVLVGLWIQTGKQIKTWKDSVTLYTHAIAVTENNAVIHSNLGTTYFEMGDLSLAENEFRKALVIEPESRKSLIGIGKVLLSQDRLEEAGQIMSKVGELDGNKQVSILETGNYYLSMEKYSHAIDLYKQYLLHNSNNAGVHKNLSTAYIKSGNLQQALFHIQTALSLDPFLPDGERMAGDVTNSAGQYIVAISHYLRFLELEPYSNKKSKVIIQLGTLLGMQKRYREALYYLELGKQMEPENSEVFNNLGNIHFLSKDFDKAKKYYQQSLELDPHNEKAKMNLQRIINVSDDM